jgi:NitT/TauT family transport system substrate-binding protein
MRHTNAAILLLLTLGLFILGITPISAQAAEELPDSEPIRIGILPDADSLPFMVADHQQLFIQHKAPVELVLFHSPVERDAAFQAGRIDGFIGDTLAALFLENGGTDISITSTTSGRYGIAASPNSGISSIEELKNESIGVSTNTIIEYAVHALFNDAGISGDSVEVTAIPKMPIRMELLLQGTIKAACLPEPLYSLVLAQGAVPVADTSQLSSAPGILIFTAQTVSERSTDLQLIYRAYQQAAEQIDANPESFRDFLIEQAGFPAPVRDSYEFVTYGTVHVPDTQEISPVADWMLSRNLIDSVPAYDELVPQDWDLEFLD